MKLLTYGVQLFLSALLLWATLIHAQADAVTPEAAQPGTAGAAAAAAAPIPDAANLLKRLEANQKELDQRRKDYICEFTEETKTLESNGAVKKTETKGYELFFESGFPVVRQVSDEGKPLSEGEAKKEARRVDEEIKKAREHAAKRERNEEDPQVLTVTQVLAAVIMKNGRRESYHDHEVLAYDFVPNSDFKPHKRVISLANKLEGTIWIDPKDLQVAGLEARLVEDFKIAGGLVGNLKKGSNIIIEQEYVNGEVWLPSLVDAGFGARILLLKSLHQRVVDRYSNYRKFRTEAVIKSVTPE